MKKSSKEDLINKFEIVVDVREKTPYKFKNSVAWALPFGDYTVSYGGVFYQNKIVVERKSNVSELYSATGSPRERWERELEKLSKVNIKFILCEFSFLDIVNKQREGVLQASSVYGSIASWQVRFGVSFIFCENRNNARAYLWKVFYEYVKHNILGY